MYMSKLPDGSNLGADYFPGDDDDATLGYAMTHYTMPDAQSTLPSAGGWTDVNWTGLINTAVNAWGQKTQLDAQVDIAKINAQSRYPVGYNPLSPSYPYGSVYSPFSVPRAGVPGGTNYMTWLIVAALVGAGYFLLKD